MWIADVRDWDEFEKAEVGSEYSIYRLDSSLWIIQESQIPDVHNINGETNHNGVDSGNQTTHI